MILLSLNAYGVVFTGMEHSLQLLLVALILLPILGKANLNHEKLVMPNYAIAALILLPLVRYEGLAISLPLLLYIFIKGERQKAIFAFLIIAVTMIGFSIFLEKQGLGLLPSSIVAKSSHSGLNEIKENLQQNILKYGFLLLPIMVIVIYFWDKDRPLGVVILATTGMHFLLGKYGWFGRYESYFLIFVMLICLRLVINLKFNFIPVFLCLPLMFFSLSESTRQTPLAASNTYNQQAQMAKLAKILAEPVAVNDLGLVALRSGQYVLDLWGLGSIDALRYRKSSTNSEWISELMEKKHVNYAFVYSTWFKQRPDNWIKVGELKLLQKRITPAEDTVVFYATDQAHAEKLSSAIKEFSQQNKSNQFSISLI